MKFQVAIIGSPSSGKTVLTAVLSRYLSGYSDRVYMNPKAAYRYTETGVVEQPTISYVNQILEILHRGEWPQGTEQGQKFELGFKLYIDGNEYEMKLLDSPGEDLKAVWINYDRTALTPFRRKLFDYILSSNVVVLIVNLDHFADAETLTARGEAENILKEAVDNLTEGGVCHYILVCFTAYDKYKAYIDQTYGGSFINYLRGELPTFYRSCEVAAKTVVRDYSEHGFDSKSITVDCIAVAPVIAQRPASGINPDRMGKPPVGFDVRNKRHSWGIPQIADWLYKCEQSERDWSDVEEKIKGGKKQSEVVSYRIIPIVLGTLSGLLVWFLLSDLILGSSVTSVTLLLSSIFCGSPVGAGIGLLIGDKLKVSITGKDGFVFKKDRSNAAEEQEEESITPRPKYTGTTSTAPPRLSGTGGTAATSGSEALD
jgi:GTPase SAR1 family protein